MKELMLSVYVPTYNHEKYIVEALDSILMQKTEYSYEVLVGEDCSTDHTREILKQYEKEHPGRIQVFYREHNMHKEEIRNSVDLRLRCKGKYMISIEGDDFWTDPLKIQKQIDFLENHPEYIGVAHNCVVVDKDSEIIDETYPECKDNEYTLEHFVSEIMPGQLATLMYRNPNLNDDIDESLMYKNLMPGDRLIYFTLAIWGRVYCMQESMSAYRHIKTEGTSFSANLKYNFKSSENWAREICRYAEKIGDRKAIKYGKLLYMRNLMIAMKQGDCSKGQVLKLFRKMHGNFGTIYLYVKCWVKHHIFHSKIWA